MLTWKRQTRGIGTLCCGTVILSGVCPCPAAADDCEEVEHETSSTDREESAAEDNPDSESATGAT